MAPVIEPEEPERRLSWAMRNHATWTDFLYRRYEQELQRREWNDRSASMLLGLSTFIIAGSATVLGSWGSHDLSSARFAARLFLLLATLLGVSAIVTLLLMLRNRHLTMTLGTWDVRRDVQSTDEYLRTRGGTFLTEPGVLGANLALDGLEQSIQENITSNDRAWEWNRRALRLVIFGSATAALGIVLLLGQPVLHDFLLMIGCN